MKVALVSLQRVIQWRRAPLSSSDVWGWGGEACVCVCNMMALIAVAEVTSLVWPAVFLFDADREHAGLSLLYYHPLQAQQTAV